MNSAIKFIFKTFSLLILLSLFSCRTLTSSFMYKTDKNFVYDELMDSAKEKEYVITYNDILDFRIYSNEGFKLIDMATSGGQNQSLTTGIIEAVDNTGMIKLPMKEKFFY